MYSCSVIATVEVSLSKIQHEIKILFIFAFSLKIMEHNHKLNKETKERNWRRSLQILKLAVEGGERVNPELDLGVCKSLNGTGPLQGMGLKKKGIIFPTI